MISRLFGRSSWGPSRTSSSTAAASPVPPPPPSYDVQTHEERQLVRAFGPAPPQPLFPWQFHANAAKLVEVRQRRRDEAEEAKRKRQEEAAKAGQPLPAEEVDVPHPASIPPEDGACLLDLLPREILLYILQDVGEETLAADCPLVSQQFNDLAHDEQLWKHRFLVDIGRQPPNFQPPSKYSNAKWHRQPVTSKEEYYHKVWKWYENYGGSIYEQRKVRFPERVQDWLGASPHANSRMALLGAIAAFDRRQLRRVHTIDRSAPRLN